MPPTTRPTRRRPRRPRWPRRTNAPWPAGVDRAVVETATQTAYAGGAAERIPAGMDFDSAGTGQGGISADATARDFATFCLRYLRACMGRRPDPGGVDRVHRRPQPGKPGIRRPWWLDLERPGVSYWVGIRGQVITVDPAHDLVIVPLSTVDGLRALNHTGAILDAFAVLDDG